MKYYFSKLGEDNSYNKVSTGRNLDKLNDDNDKIIVIGDDNIFHVITYDKSYCNEEKYVFDHSELVNYINFMHRNVYLFNSNKYQLSYILNEVNNKKEQPKLEIPLIPDGIYTLDGNKILKINATIDKNVVKDAIRDVYVRDYNRDVKFKKVKLKDFINDKTLLNIYNLPLININNSFSIPEYSYVHPSLFYILNGIYSKKLDNVIGLNEQNIKDLYLESFSEDSDIINRIINNIDITVDKQYDLNDFSKSLDYLENVKTQENDYSMELNKARNILTKAKQNEKMFNDLGILHKEENKELKKIKPATK